MMALAPPYGTETLPRSGGVSWLELGGEAWGGSCALAVERNEATLAPSAAASSTRAARLDRTRVEANSVTGKKTVGPACAPIETKRAGITLQRSVRGGLGGSPASPSNHTGSRRLRTTTRMTSRVTVIASSTANGTHVCSYVVKPQAPW